MKKISILTSTPPESSGVGEIFLSNIVQNSEITFQSRVSIVKKNNDPKSEFYNGIKSLVVKIKKSSFPLISSLYLYWFVFFRLESTAKKISNVLINDAVDSLWVTASSPEVILLAEKLTSMLPLKVYTTIWDLPDYFLDNSKLHSGAVDLIQNTFQQLLIRSEKISCISEGMVNYFVNDGIPAHKLCIVRNGIPRVNNKKSAKRDSSIQRVFFVGSLYAKNEWNVLVKALKSVNFLVSNKRIELVHIGQFPKTGVIKSGQIKFLGYRSNDEILQILTSSDIGYVPYWMNEKRQTVVRTSFPGKVSTYVMSGCKVFFHGPVKSSVADFLIDHPVGLCCPSPDTQVVIKFLGDLMAMQIDDSVRYEATNVLSIEKMTADFMEFIQ